LKIILFETQIFIYKFKLFFMKSDFKFT